MATEKEREGQGVDEIKMDKDNGLLPIKVVINTCMQQARMDVEQENIERGERERKRGK